MFVMAEPPDAGFVIYSTPFAGVLTVLLTTVQVVRPRVAELYTTPVPPAVLLVIKVLR